MSRLLCTVLLTVALLAALSCRDSDPKPDATRVPDHASPSADVTSPAPPAASASCAGARQQSGERAILVGTVERTYLLHVPPTYDRTTKMPLVLNLHGFGSNASDQALYSRFSALADTEGFIVVTPNGTGTPPRWNFVPVGSVDDVAFIDALLDDLAATLCIDETRIYAAGMSNGAAMTTFLACGLPDRIAVIAAVAATAGPRACPDSVAVPIISFRGTEDACVPYDGGTSSCGLMLPVAAAEEAIRLWSEHNGCDVTPRVEQVSPNVRRTAYESCAGDAAAVLYTIEGGGHTWPGSIFVPRLGPVTDEIDATALAWEFFQQYSESAR